MTIPKPLVSIGMMVYNAELFVRRSLESLLAQDYENFELIISDNASTDRSGDICQEYLAKDKRVRYQRNPINLGAVENGNRLIDLATGKYFMWAADHDLWDPSFISSCISVLEAKPEVVLVYTEAMLIDVNDEPQGIIPEYIDTQGLSALQRYEQLIWNLKYCFMVYGVIRRDVLVQVNRVKKVMGGDILLLSELGLRGPFAQILKPLYFRRENRPLEDPATERTSRRLYLLDPANASRKVRYSFAELMRELRDHHLLLVLKSSLTVSEKKRAFSATISCFHSRFGVRWFHSLPHPLGKMAKLFAPKWMRQKLYHYF